jgi:hypothetical protein
MDDIYNEVLYSRKVILALIDANSGDGRVNFSALMLVGVPYVQLNGTTRLTIYEYTDIKALLIQGFSCPA